MKSMCNFNEKETSIIEYIKNYIPKRLEHIISTRNLAVEIAKKYGVDTEKTSLAALCHDLGKRYTDKEMRDIIFKEKNIEYPKYYTGALLHSKVSTIIAEKDFSIKDQEILLAIENHTTGRASMSMLEKIIYASDYLEPTRNIDIANKIREKIFENFDNAFLDTVIQSTLYVLQKKVYLSEKTIELYNSLVIK